MIKGTDRGKQEFAKFLSSALDNISGTMTQQEVGYALGYTQPSIMSIMKMGRAKMPLDKIAPLARVLGVDRSRLFRLALAQYYEGEALANIAECLTGELPEDEERFLRKYRLMKDKAGANSKFTVKEVLAAIKEEEDAQAS